MQLSIVIPVKNEAKNLKDCLESVKGFDDVIIVDSDSKDETCQIAESFNRQVLQFNWNGRFPKKRNWTLKNYSFKYPWVLFLDADERLTLKFKTEVEETLKRTGHNAFWIGYNNWFLGKTLRYGDSMRKLALLRLGYGRYEEINEDRWSPLDMEVHEQLIVEGSVGFIRSKIEHHDKRNLQTYYMRHNDYASWEACRYLELSHFNNLNLRQKQKYLMLTWPIFPVLYFLSSYILKGGFLDGKAGFIFAIGKMSYFFQIQAKIYELKRARTV